MKLTAVAIWTSVNQGEARKFIDEGVSGPIAIVGAHDRACSEMAMLWKDRACTVELLRLIFWRSRFVCEAVLLDPGDCG